MFTCLGFQSISNYQRSGGTGFHFFYNRNYCMREHIRLFCSVRKILLDSTHYISTRHYVKNHHQSILPKGRSLTSNLRTKAAVLSKAGLSQQTQEPRLQFYYGWIGAVASRCFPYAPSLSLSFPLYLSLFSI